MGRPNPADFSDAVPLEELLAPDPARTGAPGEPLRDPGAVPVGELLAPAPDPAAEPVPAPPGPTRAARINVPRPANRDVSRPAARRPADARLVALGVAGVLLATGGAVVLWRGAGDSARRRRTSWDAPSSHLAASVQRAPGAPAGPAAGVTGAPSPGTAAAASSRDAALVPTAPARAASPREEPLYAGRPLAWWNERLRMLQGIGGTEGQRLRELTLRRAAGLGLQPRGGEAGAALEPAVAGTR